MSLTRPLKKFRPITERCESRDLTTAGLAGSLAAHANHTAALHILVQQKNVAVSIWNDLKGTRAKPAPAVSYTMTIAPTTPPFSEPITVKPGEANKIPYYRTFSGTDTPKFYITYYKIPGDPQSIVRDVFLESGGVFNTEGTPSRDTIFKKGKTYRFVDDGDRIQLVG
jgi:hypothetical protein